MFAAAGYSLLYLLGGASALLALLSKAALLAGNWSATKLATRIQLTISRDA